MLRCGSLAAAMPTLSPLGGGSRKNILGKHAHRGCGRAILNVYNFGHGVSRKWNNFNSLTVIGVYIR